MNHRLQEEEAKSLHEGEANNQMKTEVLVKEEELPEGNRPQTTK